MVVVVGGGGGGGSGKWWLVSVMRGILGNKRERVERNDVIIIT